MVLNFLNKSGVKINTREEMERVLECGARLLKQPSEMELNVAFVSKEEIQEVNNRTRGKNNSTDVLSFPAFDLKSGELINLEHDKYKWNINPENEHFVLGDMLLCLDVAKAQAKEFKHSLNDEIIKLTVHSFLHCLGYDHIEDSDYELMKSKEELILKETGYENLV